MAEDQVGLLAAAEDFAGQLNALVAEVLPGQQPSFLAEATADGMVTVAPARDDEDRERAPLWIVVKGSAREHQLLIRAEYVCHWDRSRRFLSVVSSQVRLSLKGVNDPLFRLHYDRGKREGDLPAAHLHVHGHRDELLYLLTLSERGRPKRLRARDKVPQMSGLHLPVGGERFRPTLEHGSRSRQSSSVRSCPRGGGSGWSRNGRGFGCCSFGWRCAMPQTRLRRR